MLRININWRPTGTPVRRREFEMLVYGGYAALYPSYEVELMEVGWIKAAGRIHHQTK